MAAVAGPLSAEAIFDSVGPAYEDAFAGLETQAASIEWLKSQLAGKKPAKVLDIGCGTGRPVCLQLANAGHDVTGIDISTAMIEASRKNVPNATFEKVDIENFKPGPGTFDAITVYFSIIASVTQDQIRRYIQSIFTWLKPGGVLVYATVPVAGNNLEFNWMGRPVVASSLEAEEYGSWIQTVGFDVVKNETSTFTPRGVEAGICKEGEVWEEPHLFIYAKKP